MDLKRTELTSTSPLEPPKGIATKTAKLYPINTLLKLISKLVPIPKSFGPLSKNGSDTHQINDPIVLNEPGKFLTNKPC